MDEERRQLLRRIVEAMARRQLASINILGHCLKFVGELDAKDAVASELNLSLRLFRQVHTLYRDLGWTDLESAVRDRLDDVPYPASRLEFGVAYYVMGIAEEVAMRSYVDSTCPEFAAIARSHVEAAQRRPKPKRFVTYCEDPEHRPQAQQFFDRWYRIGVGALGRRDSSADARVVDLGLRSERAGELRERFHARLAPFVEACALAFPESLSEAEA